MFKLFIRLVLLLPDVAVQIAYVFTAKIHNRVYQYIMPRKSVLLVYMVVA